MAIIRLGLKVAEKGQGSNLSGKKIFLVGSDVKISDDIDTILDASYLGGEAIPAYDDLWSVDTTVNLRVDTKRALSYDMAEGTQEGYWWTVEVNYQVPDISNGQSAEDPTEREWLWSDSGEEVERALVATLFDTAGYTYPGPGGFAKMVNLVDGAAITNTAFEPPENGVAEIDSVGVITLSKYINDATDLGVAGFGELYEYRNTLNNAPVTILGITYAKWELLMKEISAEPVSINGYDVVQVVMRITADTTKTHVYSFPSAGYNQIIDGELVRIKNETTGEDVQSPRLLDDEGAAQPLPVVAPYVGVPYIVSVGRNILADWSTLSLPTTRPI